MKYNLPISILFILFQLLTLSCRKSKENHIYKMNFHPSNSVYSDFQFNILIESYKRRPTNHLIVSNISSFYVTESIFTIDKRKLSGHLFNGTYDAVSHNVNSQTYILSGTATTRKIWGNYKRTPNSFSTVVLSEGTFEMDLTKSIK